MSGIGRLSGRLRGTTPFVIAALVATSASAQNAGVAQGMSTGAPSAEDRLDAALHQIGMTQCSGVVTRAARFLFEDGEANFTVQPLGPDANRWPTVIMIEGAHKAAGATRLTSLTVSPGMAGCAGFYEQVISWPTPCDQLKSTTFASFQNPKVILRNVKVSELGPGLQLYLMPSGAGCVSVKKELFH